MVYEDHIKMCWRNFDFLKILNSFIFVFKNCDLVYISLRILKMTILSMVRESHSFILMKTSVMFWTRDLWLCGRLTMMVYNRDVWGKKLLKSFLPHFSFLNFKLMKKYNVVFIFKLIHSVWILQPILDDHSNTSFLPPWKVFYPTDTFETIISKPSPTFIHGLLRR